MSETGFYDAYVIITIFSPERISSVRRFINVNTMGVTRELNVRFYERKTRVMDISYFCVRRYGAAVRSIWCAGSRKMLTILVRLLCQY